MSGRTDMTSKQRSMRDGNPCHVLGRGTRAAEHRAGQGLAPA
ncbi:MAG: hypothetical protein AB7T63_05710 [Planctomycetota bacterium]